jgi:hypothetical protein
MNKQELNAKIRHQVTEHAAGRGESASFLIWFLENYFRLDHDDAIGAICDHTNDKGIDGIFVDDEDEAIYLFQSKYSTSDNQDQGDNDLRNFVGARQWFASESSVNELLNSTASQELKSLIVETNIIEKINFKKVLVFVTNRRFNSHATEYLSVAQDIEAYDCEYLFEKYTYFADQEITFPPIDLYLSNLTKIEYELPPTKVRVYSIQAKELLRLQGIQDRTLFYKNVRYGVGNTRINKDIKDTIENLAEHKNFFMYHNGISIVCSNLVEDLDHKKITLSNYAVINGCQSMLSFYENQSRLTNHLFILVKVIQVSGDSPLTQKVTHNANNQNAISIRDLRSNDSVQKALQREFKEVFRNQVFYVRKRGESEVGYSEIIGKDFAAQIVESVYLGNPQSTHLKQKLFGEDYSKIFSRKINAEKIYMGSLLYSTVKDNAGLLSDVHIRDYGLALCFFSFVLSEIMRESTLGKRILEKPKEYVTTKKAILMATLKKEWELITPDINIDIEEYAERHNNYFDYKNLFKNSQFVKEMSRKIRADYTRLVRRNEKDSFERIFEEQSIRLSGK